MGSEDMKTKEWDKGRGTGVCQRAKITRRTWEQREGARPRAYLSETKKTKNQKVDHSLGIHIHLYMLIQRQISALW
jgi:hypothetical protein